MQGHVHDDDRLSQAEATAQVRQRASDRSGSLALHDHDLTLGKGGAPNRQP